MADLWIPPDAQRKMAQAKRYSATELVALANSQSLNATQPLLYEWVRLGLMGRPEEGERGLWKPAQASLWLKLLETRRQKHAHIIHLCNLPVGGWIFFGEEVGAISLAQVQLVMRSWAERVKPPTLDQARRITQHLVKQIKTKDAQQVRHAKKQLQDLMARSNTNIDALLDPITLLMEGRKPEKKGQTKGPKDSPLSVEALIDTWETRQKAIHNVHRFDDWMWQWARIAYLFGLNDYLRHYPQLANEAHQFPDLQEMFQVETLTTLVSGSCMDLLTLVQVAYENIHKPPSYHPSAEIPEFLHVKYWHSGEISGDVHSEPVLNGLGQPVSLQISIEIKKNEVAGKP